MLKNVRESNGAGPSAIEQVSSGVPRDFIQIGKKRGKEGDLFYYIQ
jgi:hypothetical protein